MQQVYVSLAGQHPPAIPPSLIATDPVGGVGDSVPVHPDDKRPGSDEFKQKKRRNLPPSQPSVPPDGKHPDPDHQIDEYA